VPIREGVLSVNTLLFIGSTRSLQLIRLRLFVLKARLRVFPAFLLNTSSCGKRKENKRKNVFLRLTSEVGCEK
jgi:hypothetical protein